MEQITVSFPGLGIGEFQLNKIAFTLFGKLEVRWYGLIITTGIILAVLYCAYRSAECGVTKDDLLDLALYTVIFGVLGARLYYVLMTLGTYSYKNIIDVFAIWEGGLAIYGGIILGVVAAVLFSRAKKINFFDFGDMAVICLLIGQMIGRWGNFVNAEAFGGITSLPWGMSINGAAMCHPTFLYESLWNLVGFVFLHFYSRHRRFKGELILIYFGWYGLGRGWIEGLRTDSLYLGNTDIRVSQLLAVVSLVVCAALLIYLHVTKKYKSLSYLSLDKPDDKE